jgi:dTDP-4-amino-4,6-dideoxygalactose transaminase
MKKYLIPFNRPFMTGKELYYIAKAQFGGNLAGNGSFTKLCHEWLERNTQTAKALLTHSCTAALEMTALLIDIVPGDEIIMPSFTFVSTANAYVLRGATPVFVDIREDTLNIDERLIESAITERTKAIVVVHYAGISCEMDEIMNIAGKYGLIVIEDAAQGVMAEYRNRALGSIGHLGTYSFHETKNITSGEGGALLVNNSDLIAQAEIIWEKGTDRSRYFSGQIDKYTWQVPGSSFLPNEVTAAFLFAQFEEADGITQKRINSWNLYHEIFYELEKQGRIRRPVVPHGLKHNAHIYYLLLNESFDRKVVLSKLTEAGINCVFHYVPLHLSPAGRCFGRTNGDLKVTERQSSRLIRLPLWFGIDSDHQQYIVDTLQNIFLEL